MNTYIRWKRRHIFALRSAWHHNVQTGNDAYYRTACGLDVPIAKVDAETTDNPEGHLCSNCKRAMRKVPTP